MLIAILADIHGNLPALEAALARIEPLHPDAFWLAGDYVGGPDVDQTLDLLRAFSPLAILGNSDMGVLRYLSGEGPDEWRLNKQFAMLRWNSRHIREDHVAWLRSLPEERVIELQDLPTVRIVHGRPGSATDGLWNPKDEPGEIDIVMAAIAETGLICGHSHEAWCWREDGRLALNPGSVAADLAGDPRAKYALIETNGQAWEVQLCAAEYDLAAKRRAFELSGLSAEGGPLARGYLLSSLTGRDVSRYFLEYAYAHMKDFGYPDGPFIPDEVWDWAEATFEWDRYSADKMSPPAGR